MAWFSSVWLLSYTFKSVVALLFKGAVPKWTLPFLSTSTKIKWDKALFPVGTTGRSSFVPMRCALTRLLFRFMPPHINSFARCVPLHVVLAQIGSFSFQRLIHASPSHLDCSGRSESFSSVLNSINVPFVIHELRMLFGVYVCNQKGDSRRAELRCIMLISTTTLSSTACKIKSFNLALYLFFFLWRCTVDSSLCLFPRGLYGSSRVDEILNQTQYSSVGFENDIYFSSKHLLVMYSLITSHMTAHLKN